MATEHVEKIHTHLNSSPRISESLISKIVQLYNESILDYTQNSNDSVKNYNSNNKVDQLSDIVKNKELADDTNNNLEISTDPIRISQSSDPLKVVQSTDPIKLTQSTDNNNNIQPIDTNKIAQSSDTNKIAQPSDTNKIAQSSDNIKTAELNDNNIINSDKNKQHSRNISKNSHLSDISTNTQKSDKIEHTSDTIKNAFSSFLLEFFNKNQINLIFKKLNKKFKNKNISCENFISFIQPYFSNSLTFAQYNLYPQSTLSLDSIVSQFQSFIIQRGIDFNLMLVGSRGVGKSTLCNTIFNCPITSGDCLGGNENECQIIAFRRVIEDNLFKIRLCLYDTVGFGDLVDNTDCCVPIINKINELYLNYFKKETSIERDPLNIDSRIHCILYFIQPNGHKLSLLDLDCLKKLSTIATVIPIIARADSLTVEELDCFKKRVKADLEDNSILCYPDSRFIIFQPDPNESHFQQIKSKSPLAVIGANIFDSETKKQYRKVNCGTIDIYDQSNCDMSLLYDILIRKHMLNIIQTTDKIYYEYFRKNHLLKK